MSKTGAGTPISLRKGLGVNPGEINSIALEYRFMFDNISNQMTFSNTVGVGSIATLYFTNQTGSCAAGTYNLTYNASNSGLGTVLTNLEQGKWYTLRYTADLLGELEVPDGIVSKIYINGVKVGETTDCYMSEGKPTAIRSVNRNNILIFGHSTESASDFYIDDMKCGVK